MADVEYTRFDNISPGILLREYELEDYNGFYAPIYSYLNDNPVSGYLRKPIDPYDRASKSAHFHLPPGRVKCPSFLDKPGSKSGMRALVETLSYRRPETPRAPSVQSNVSGDEPIELARFPDAKVPSPNMMAKIDREDFPAPPYPYTDPVRRRRWSGHKEDDEGDEEDQPDAEQVPVNPKFRKEEEELQKISSGIGKVFLHDAQERSKIQQWKQSHLDPRSASRTPAARTEPGFRLRYQSPVNASPSRYSDHKHWDDYDFDRGAGYRSSTGARNASTLQGYSAVRVRAGPRSATLPVCGRYGGPVRVDIRDFTYSSISSKKPGDLSSTRSDDSLGSLTEADKLALNDIPSSMSYGSMPHTESPRFRYRNERIVNINPDKRYTLQELTARKLPTDVDRCNLERHLTAEDFQKVFQMSKDEFYQQPEWKRKNMKKKLKLY